MKTLSFIVAFTSSLLTAHTFAQTETIPLEIIDEQGDTTTILITWPDTRSSGSSGQNIAFEENQLSKRQEKKVMRSIHDELSINGVDCPPERRKAGPTVWICGNGKTIRTTSEKLALVLSNHWDN